MTDEKEIWDGITMKMVPKGTKVQLKGCCTFGDEDFDEIVLERDYGEDELMDLAYYEMLEYLGVEGSYEILEEPEKEEDL